MSDSREDSRPIRLSVVVCTRNRAADVERCLLSVAREVGADAMTEVIVVDNASSDHTQQILDRMRSSIPSLRVEVEPVLGLARARNRALNSAVGEIIAFVDDDATLEPGWRDALISTFDHLPHIGGLAGRITLVFEGGRRPTWLAPQLDTWFACLDLGDQPRSLTEQERPFGANMAVRRELGLSVGGFDPSLGYQGTRLLGNEESDFFDRVAGAGHPLYYDPAVTVLHHISATRLRPRWILRRTFAQGRTNAALRFRSDPTRRELARLVWAAATGGLLRGWRAQLGRLLKPGGRSADLMTGAASRAKQLGFAWEGARQLCTRSTRN